MKILKRRGINKFIALGHSGIEVDIEIAKSIPDIDIVIGGHTNTFLYTGWFQSDILYSHPSSPFSLFETFTIGEIVDKGDLNIYEIR